MRKHQTGSVQLLCGAAAVALVACAGAPAAAQVATPQSPAADASGAGAESEIVVTGSRIAGSALSTPTAVNTISNENLATLAPSSIGQALNKLPQFSGSTNSRQTNTGGGNVLGAAQGELLNLRGLGTNRTLVLLNGNRVPPTQANGSVDVSMMPSAFVQRVDVVTGGASAAYGSDAVVGVVNYVLDTHYTGLKLSAQAGISSRGDDFSYKLMAAGGFNFGQDNRGHLLLSFERYQDSGIGTQQARKGWDLVRGGAGTSTNPFQTYANGRYRVFPPGGSPVAAAADQAVLGAPFVNGFRSDGSLYARTFGTNTNNALVDSGGDGIYVTDEVLIPDVRSENYFGRLSYEVAPGIEPYVQLAYSERRTDQRSIIFSNLANTSFAAIIQPGNPYLAPAIRNAFSSPFSLSRGNFDFPITVTDTLGTNLFAQAGVTGEIGSNWKWDVNYTYGKNVVTARTKAEPSMPRFAAALDAVRDTNGNIVCNVSLTNPGLYPGCVPLNLFGVGSESLAAMNYVLGAEPSMVRIANKMQSGSVNLRGTLLQNWAGDVKVAVGGEIRKQTLIQDTNADAAAPPSRTGLRSAPAGMLWYYNKNYGKAAGSVTVKEAYAEVLFPLLSDVMLAKSLNLSGAVRYTDYSTSGGVTTWKAGVSWRPVSDLTFRAAFSRDIRAPSLNELFQGVSIAQATATDPRFGQATTLGVSTLGNANLRPEKAETLTAGFTFTPSFARGLTITADYYDLKFSDVIFSPTFSQILQACEDSKPAYNAPQCALITRASPTSLATAVLAVPLNQATRRVRGLDFSVDYRFDADRIFPGASGEFGIGGSAALLITDRSQNSPTAPVVQNDGFGIEPGLKGSIYVNYQNDVFGVTVTNRFTGKSNRAQAGVPEIYADSQYWPNRVYTDLALTYKLTPQATAFINVDNLFDVAMPALGSSNQPGLNFFGNRAIYDVVGMYFTAGVRVSLDKSELSGDADAAPASGFYMGLGAGAGFVHSGGALLKQPTTVTGYAAAPVVATNISFKTGNGVQALLGYRWNSGVRAELEFNQMSASVSRFNGTSGTGRQENRGVMANVLYDFMPQARFTPFAGVGIGLDRVEWKHVTQVADPMFDGFKWTFKWQAQVGGKVRLTPHVDLYAKYQYAQSGKMDIYSQPFNTQYDIGARVSDYKNKTSLVSAGVTYSF